MKDGSCPGRDREVLDEATILYLGDQHPSSRHRVHERRQRDRVVEAEHVAFVIVPNHLLQLRVTEIFWMSSMECRLHPVVDIVVHSISLVALAVVNVALGYV